VSQGALGTFFLALKVECIHYILLIWSLIDRLIGKIIISFINRLQVR
jgi:hypothetical protein